MFFVGMLNHPTAPRSAAFVFDVKLSLPADGDLKLLVGWRFGSVGWRFEVVAGDLNLLDGNLNCRMGI